MVNASGISIKFELQPTQITLWKKEFLNNASVAFEKESKIDDSEKEKDKLYRKIRGGE